MQPWLVATLVTLSYLLASVACFWDRWTSSLTTNLQNGSDTVLNTWGFAWLPHALGHGLNPFFTNVVGYPGGVNVLANTSQLSLALIFTPTTLIWSPILSFNLALLLSPVAAGAAAYLLARRFTDRRLLAWVGGLVFGFSPYVVTAVDSSHLQMAFVAAVPLLFLVLHLVFSEAFRGPFDGPRRNPVVLGAAFAGIATLQFFISTEVLFTTALLIVIATLTVVISSPRKVWAARAYLSWAGLSAVGFSGLLLGYPLWFAVAGPGHVKGPEILTPQAYRADLLGPLYPTHGQLIAPHHLAKVSEHFATAAGENYSYLGLPLVLGAVVALLWLIRRRDVLAAGVVALSSFVLSLGGGLAVTGLPQLREGTTASGTWLPGKLLEHLPIFESVIPSRYALFTVIAACCLLVALLDRILPTGRRAAWRWVLASTIAAAVIASLIPSGSTNRPYGSTTYEAPSQLVAWTTGVVPEGKPVLTYPYPSWADLSPIVWQWQQAFRYKTPAGYFRVPQGRDDHVAFSDATGYAYVSTPAKVFIGLQLGHPPALTPELKADFKRTLRRWNLRWVVALVAPNAQAGPTHAYLKALLGTPLHREPTLMVWQLRKAPPR